MYIVSLFYSTATRKPSFETCATKAIGPNNEMEMSQTVGPTTECKYQADYYGSFQPTRLHYRLLAQFKIDTSTFPSKPSYIQSYNFGVTDVILEAVSQGITGKCSLREFGDISLRPLKCTREHVHINLLIT